MISFNYDNNVDPIKSVIIDKTNDEYLLNIIFVKCLVRILK